MNYDQAISYIESFKDRGIKLGLDRVKALLYAIGDPQENFRTIHIAGTNGKGSVAAMLSSVLTKAGYRTGLYTSPHLVDYTERIRINEKDISKEKLAFAIESVKKAIQRLKKIKLTEFEVLTAAGFLVLARENVEIAIIEVGLGGRFDATNVLDPMLSIITNIEMDHTDLLGNTLQSIAKEKGGIIKDSVPLVSGEKRVSGILKKICHLNNSRYIQAHPVKNKTTNLLGNYQKFNEGIVLRTIEVLGDNGLKVSKRNIVDGLRKTRWPGRFQMISRKPLIILDGAHNPAGAKALSAGLKSFNRKFNIIIGMQKNKNKALFIKTLKPMANKFIFIRSSNLLAAEESELANIGNKLKINYVVSDSIGAALKTAGNSGAVCITGSLYLIGDVLRDYKKTFALVGPF